MIGHEKGLIRSCYLLLISYDFNQLGFNSIKLVLINFMNVIINKEIVKKKIYVANNLISLHRYHVKCLIKALFAKFVG